MSDLSLSAGKAGDTLENGYGPKQDATSVELTLSHINLQGRPVTQIADQAFVFSVAAATTRARPTRWWTKAVRVAIAATGRVFMVAPADARPRERHYPSRDGILEDSRMEREMHRL